MLRAMFDTLPNGDHLLVGKDAQRFARNTGFKIEDDLNTDKSRKLWLEWKRRTDPSHYLDPKTRAEAWRKVKAGMRWSAHTDPEAARALAATFLDRDFRLLRGYLADPAESWPEPMYSQTTLRITYAEAEALGEKVFALLEPYFTGKRADAPEDAEDIWFVTFGVPYDR